MSNRFNRRVSIEISSNYLKSVVHSDVACLTSSEFGRLNLNLSRRPTDLFLYSPRFDISTRAVVRLEFPLNDIHAKNNSFL